jgi:enterochelin esterase family protein
VSRAIEELLRLPRIGPQDVDRFVRGREFPLIDGRQATFVYRGQASAVELIHWIYGLESSMPFQRVAGSDLWYLSMDVPEGSRIEYKLGVVHGAQQALIRDPLNPKLARDPYGANSVVQGSGYFVPDWIHEDDWARKGEIVRLGVDSAAFGGRREVEIYLPARFRASRRYPLLVVHDGPDYVRFASLKTILDNLIHRLEVPPLIVALTESPDRLREYADDERHARFLVDELVPALARTWPLVDAPEARGLMGASFGAVASLATAWRHPGRFGRLLLQSGSFVFTDIGRRHGRSPAFDPVVDFVNAFRANPGKPAEKLFVSCGTYESLIYYNRSLVPLLQQSGMDVKFVEQRDGHNWENWRDRLREGLSWLFPGPLWMVYE